MLRKKVLVFWGLLASFCFFFVFLSQVLAQDPSWSEDFEGSLSNNWVVYENSGMVDYHNSWLFLASSGSSYPYLHSSSDFFGGFSDFALEIKFRYSSIGPWGTGITIGNDVFPNNITQSLAVQNDAKVAQFKIWQDWNAFRIKYHENEQEAFSDAIEIVSRPPDMAEHIVKIEKIAGKYIVYLDSIKVFTSAETSRIPNSITIGNALTIGGSLNAWSNLSLDYIKIFGDGSKSAIIIIPGLGASWNTEAILKGEESPQSEWEMTPFVNIYDNLTSTLENAGYEKDKDFFVFNYDWRQPIEDIAQELDEFIDNNISGEQVNLIGHSLGGLVSRAWWQNNNDDKLAKIITLGTPHQGVVQAYEALTGGKIGDSLNWSSVAINILLRLRNSFYKTTASILRQETPILSDLLPVFDFVKKGRRIVSSTKLTYKNDWLINANQSLDDLEKIEFVSGQTGTNVNEWLKVKSTNLVEKLLGLWPDGVPYRYYEGKGDETVLLKSSYLENKEPHIYNIAHRYLPHKQETIEKILDILKINSTVTISNVAYPRDNTLIFMIASPATLEVIDPQDQAYQADSQGFVVIPNPLSGSYQVRLQGTGEGEYHLLVGQLFLRSFWNNYQGNIQTGEELTYDFNIDSDSPRKNPLSDSEKHRLEIALREIKSLKSKYSSQFLTEAEAQVEQAIGEVKSEQWPTAIDRVKQAIVRLFEFRKQQAQLSSLKESEKPIKLLTDVLGSLLEKDGDTSSRQARKEYLKARRQRSLSWRTIRLQKRRKKLNDLSLIANQTGTQYLDEAKGFLKQKNYKSLFAHSFTAFYFFKEIF